MDVFIPLMARVIEMRTRVEKSMSVYSEVIKEVSWRRVKLIRMIIYQKFKKV